MLHLRRATLIRSLLTTLFLIGLSTAASAATVTATATGGRGLDGTLTIDDGIDPGNLVITFNLNAARGDIRAFFAHIADESLLSGLSVVGRDDRYSQFREDRISSSGAGRAAGACPCDFGLRFPSRSGTSVSFTLTHETANLTLDLFYGQDFAVKASKVRMDQGEESRGRSRGMRHVILLGRVPSPIPEPTTAVLMALGLGGLSYAGRSQKS